MRERVTIKAQVAVFSEDESRILFQFDRSIPDFLRFPGGSVEAGETMEECIERELYREEFGVKIAEIRPWIICENFFGKDGKEFHELVVIHSGRLLNDPGFPQLHREREGVRLDWFEIAALPGQKVVPNGILSFLTSPRERIYHFSNFGFD